ncbi:polysaccharide deacetylase family protein [Streptomyces sp. NPDC046939]|uniref:polysaccharide deacetylase family protein n=1 Tax=Streptomyces sp. NPDC046939 TaxID=3155376 RepID=UPI00340A9A8F
MRAPARDGDRAAVPVLMYHAVTDEPGRAVRRLSVTPGQFATQMEILAAHRRTPLTVAELAALWRGRGGRLPARPVLLTFDDGYEGVHRHALPVLAAHGFTATLFVATGWLRGPYDTGGGLDTMLDWGQVRELAAHGVEIGGHSHTHPPLDQLTSGELRLELARCLDVIGDELGAPPVSFAYPYGHSDRRVRQAVRAAGFAQALAVGNGLARRRQGPYALRRLTVRRSTGPEVFERLVEGRAVGAHFAGDRALTKAYAVLRGARRAVRARG